LAGNNPLRLSIEAAKGDREQVRIEMARLQEELDWLVYEIYGLLSPDSGARSRSLADVDNRWPDLRPDDRPYRHPETGGVPTWDEVDRERHRIVSVDGNIGLIERPDFKRRWFRSAGAYDDTNLNDDMLIERGVLDWLLDRIEDPRHW